MHTDETNLIDKHQFKSRQRTGIRTEATLIQHKVPLYTFDSKAIIISEFYTIVLSTLNMNYSLCHTIVLELNSQQSDAITHTILEDKLRFEIKTEPVTLMESSISFNFKTATVEALIRREYHRSSILPDIGSIANSSKIVKITISCTVSTQCNHLFIQSFSQILIHIMQQFCMAHIINHRTVEVCRGDIMFLQYSLAISQTILLTTTVFVLRHSKSDVIIEENIRHLSFREHISWQRRLARSKGCTKGYYPTEIKKSFLHDYLSSLFS